MTEKSSPQPGPDLRTAAQQALETFDAYMDQDDVPTCMAAIRSLEALRAALAVSAPAGEERRQLLHLLDDIVEEADQDGYTCYRIRDGKDILFSNMVGACARLLANPASPSPTEAPTEWQPVETAPKDGRDLLLWESGSSVPFVGAWRGGRRPGWHCDTEHYNTDGNACVVSNLWQEGVTHWMPLPTAPKKD